MYNFSTIAGFCYEHRTAPIKQSIIHTTTDYEIFFLMKGTCNHFINDKWYSLSAGSILLYPPDALIWNNYTSDYYMRSIISFPKSFLPNSFLHILDLIFKKRFYVFNDIIYGIKLFDKIQHEYENRDIFSEEFLRADLMSLLSYLYRQKDNEDSFVRRLSHPAIDKTTHYINKNFDQPITLEECAAQVDLNPFYLSQLFIKHTGIAFKKYVQLIRIGKSKKLLIDTNYSVNKIAFDCGFNDSCYFSAVFKKITGMNPLQFRKQYTK